MASQESGVLPGAPVHDPTVVLVLLVSQQLLDGWQALGSKHEQPVRTIQHVSYVTHAMRERERCFIRQYTQLRSTGVWLFP